MPIAVTLSPQLSAHATILVLSCHGVTLLHSERPKLYTILAFLGAIGLKIYSLVGNIKMIR